jgi:hypothetical protein
MPKPIGELRDGVRPLARQLLFDRFGYPSITRHDARPLRAARVYSVEGLGRQAKIDAIQGPNGCRFRIKGHGATLAPHRFGVQRCFYFVLMGADVNSAIERGG